MPYLGEVMTKTKALRRWNLRHNLRRILRGKRWIRVKDIKLASVHPHDARGVPFEPIGWDYELVDSRYAHNAILELLLERNLSDYVDGGDDE